MPLAQRKLLFCRKVRYTYFDCNFVVLLLELKSKLRISIQFKFFGWRTVHFILNPQYLRTEEYAKIFLRSAKTMLHG